MTFFKLLLIIIIVLFVYVYISRNSKSIKVKLCRDKDSNRFYILRLVNLKQYIKNKYGNYPKTNIFKIKVIFIDKKLNREFIIFPEDILNGFVPIRYTKYELKKIEGIYLYEYNTAIASKIFKETKFSNK